MVVAVIVRVVAPVIVRIVATGIVQVSDAVIAPVIVVANAARFARRGHADDGHHHHCFGAGLGAGTCLCPVARPVMDVLRDAIVCVSLPVRDSLCAVPVAFRPAPGPASAGRHAPTPTGRPARHTVLRPVGRHYRRRFRKHPHGAAQGQKRHNDIDAHEAGKAVARVDEVAHGKRR